jgi:hypothetical protein
MKTTELTGTAAVTVTGQYSEPGCPRSQTIWTGSIDFVHTAISLRSVRSTSRFNLCTQARGLQLREFGDVEYQTFPAPSCTPHPACSVNSSGPSLTTLKRPWFRNSAAAYDPDAVQTLQSPFALAVLDVMPSAMRHGAFATIRGQPTHEYSTNVSLAQLESAVRNDGAIQQAVVNLDSPLGAIPPSSTIPLAIQVWVDSSHRVVRLSMSQPFYVVNFVSGESAGSTQFPPGFNAPNDKPSDYPYKQGYQRMTIDFSDFGTSQHPVRPPPGEVSTGG